MGMGGKLKGLASWNGWKLDKMAIGKGREMGKDAKREGMGSDKGGQARWDGKWDGIGS